MFFFLKLMIFIACSLKDSQNLFMHSLPLYRSGCIDQQFSIYLNNDIVDIEKTDGICLVTFNVDDFSGLFLQTSVFSIKDSKST